MYTLTKGELRLYFPFLSNCGEYCLKSKYLKNDENQILHVTIVKKAKEELFNVCSRTKRKVFSNSGV